MRTVACRLSGDANGVNIARRSSHLNLLFWTTFCATSPPAKDVESLGRGAKIDVIKALGCLGAIPAGGINPMVSRCILPRNFAVGINVILTSAVASLPPSLPPLSWASGLAVAGGGHLVRRSVEIASAQASGQCTTRRTRKLLSSCELRSSRSWGHRRPDYGLVERPSLQVSNLRSDDYAASQLGGNWS